MLPGLVVTILPDPVVPVLSSLEVRSPVVSVLPSSVVTCLVVSELPSQWIQVVPEVLSLSSTLPVKATAILCVWTTHTSLTAPVVVTSVATSPEPVASAVAPPEVQPLTPQSSPLWPGGPSLIPQSSPSQPGGPFLNSQSLPSWPEGLSLTPPTTPLLPGGPFLNFLSYLLTLSWLGVPSLNSLCYHPILLWPQRPSMPCLLQPWRLPLGLFGSLSLLCGGLPLCHGAILCHAGHLLCHGLQILLSCRGTADPLHAANSLKACTLAPL